MPAAAHAEAGAAERPQGQRRAARAARRQQARGRRAGHRDLGAGAQVETAGRAAPDEPEEHDVAGEGEHLGDGGDPDPARVRRERAVQRVGEDPERPAGEEEHREGDRGERRRRRGAPGHRAEVEAGEGEVRDG